MKMIINSFFSLLLFATISCNQTNKQEQTNEMINQTCNNLDTCINNEIYFINGQSMLNAFENYHSAWRLNDRIYFINKDSSIYISFGFNYGGGINEYKEAEIGYILENSLTFVPDEVLNSSFNPKNDYMEPKFYFTPSKFNDFATESGIKLGIPESQLKEIAKTKSWDLKKEQTDSTTIYRYKNEYCMYEAEYIFKQGKLNQFSFGYITP